MRQGMRIGIVGAGIGGLAAASLLADRGGDVTLFDQFERPAPVGSGLIIQPVGQAVLDEVGCGAAARAHGASITRMLGHEAVSGRKVLDVSYAPRSGLAIHRSALFNALFDAVTERAVKLRSGIQVTGRDGSHLTSEAGRYGPFDLIVDAAGAGSPLSPMVARPLPYGAIWGTVDWPETVLPNDRLSQMYRRADRMMGVLPLGVLPGDPMPKAAIFWSMPRDAHDAWITSGLSEWKDAAMQIWPAFEPFLTSVDDPDLMTMARYSHGTLRKPWGDGIVHIGDAAHRASPQLGQGANMALLDAAALVRALDILNPQDALRAYGMSRRWHVRIYQVMSAVFTPQYQSDSRVLPWIRDRVLTPISEMPPVPRVLTRLVCGDMIPPLGSLTSSDRV